MFVVLNCVGNMITGTVVLKLLIFCLVDGVLCEKVYVASFTDDVMACEGFENSFVDCSEVKLSQSKTDDGIDACGLSGPMELLADVEEGHEIMIEIWKELPCDKEMMWAIRTGVCEALQYEDAPWKCLVEAMNIKGCPIGGGTYDIKDLVVSLDFLQEVMNYEFCGDYKIKVQMMSATDDTLACFEVGVNIVEKDSD